MIYIVILFILLLLLLKTLNLKSKNVKEEFKGNSEIGYISYGVQKEIASKGDGSEDPKYLQYRWWDKYSVRNKDSNQNLISRNEKKKYR
jgi:hypothetical protein